MVRIIFILPLFICRSYKNIHEMNVKAYLVDFIIKPESVNLMHKFHDFELSSKENNDSFNLYHYKWIDEGIISFYKDLSSFIISKHGIVCLFIEVQISFSKKKANSFEFIIDETVFVYSVENYNIMVKTKENEQLNIKTKFKYHNIEFAFSEESRKLSFCDVRYQNSYEIIHIANKIFVYIYDAKMCLVFNFEILLLNDNELFKICWKGLYFCFDNVQENPDLLNAINNRIKNEIDKTN